MRITIYIILVAIFGTLIGILLTQTAYGGFTEVWKLTVTVIVRAWSALDRGVASVINWFFDTIRSGVRAMIHFTWQPFAYPDNVPLGPLPVPEKYQTDLYPN